jgi:predicted dehydrogenase
MAMAVKIVQVGLGGWGLDWAVNVLPKVGTADVVAFVDADPKAIAAARARLKLPADRFFPSLEAALASVEAEGLLGVLPTAGHRSLAGAGLAAGLHVLIEKPFTSTLDEARALIEEARARRRVLMVSQNYRYHDAVMAAANLVAQRRYGRPLTVSIEFRQDWKATGHRYHDIPGPLLLDMGIHHFDMLRMILGRDVVRVACHAWNTPYSPFKDYAAAHALLDCGDGVVVSYGGSWLRRGVPTTWTGDWSVECEEGDLLFCARPGDIAAPQAGKLFLRGVDGRVEELAIERLGAVDRAGSLDAFARAVASGTAPAHAPLAADNIASLATSFACMRSAREDGRWVEVEAQRG